MLQYSHDGDPYVLTPRPGKVAIELLHMPLSTYNRLNERGKLSTVKGLDACHLVKGLHIAMLYPPVSLGEFAPDALGALGEWLRKDACRVERRLRLLYTRKSYMGVFLPNAAKNERWDRSLWFGVQGAWRLFRQPAMRVLMALNMYGCRLEVGVFGARELEDFWKECADVGGCVGNGGLAARGGGVEAGERLGGSKHPAQSAQAQGGRIGEFLGHTQENVDGQIN